MSDDETDEDEPCAFCCASTPHTHSFSEVMHYFSRESAAALVRRGEQQ